MFGLGTWELVLLLTIIILLCARKKNQAMWDNFRNGGGPFDGGSGFEFQSISASDSELSRCRNCGAQTKDSFENCPVCGEKTGEILVASKKYSTV
jgi:uncharacterized paraquat-inducible protein A